MKFTTTLLKWTLALTVLIAGAGCTKDKTDAPDGYGYVQLRLYKSGSYTRADMLDYLHDAAKIKITLRSSDNSIISQTVNVEAANDKLAEYGMQSDKLLLMADEYTVIGFEIFDKLDSPVLSGEPETTTVIRIIPGGLVAQDIVVKVVERGHVRFQLTKDLSQITTRANESGKYPFYSIMYADVKVRNNNTGETTEFKGLKMTHRVITPEDRPDYYTSICETDSIITLKAGNYDVTGYITYFDRNRKIAEASTGNIDSRFAVYDNKTTTADVPITLVESAGYIKDALVLKQIWDSLDGPNWKVKWDFNRDVDLWMAQPGVSVLEDGRIAVLNLTSVGAKGHMPAILGELTELRQLYLGSHSYDTGTSNLNPTKALAELASTDKEAFRRSFLETFFHNGDPLEIFSPEMQLSFTLNDVPIKKGSGTLRSLPTANNPVNYSNLVYSLPSEINNLKRLENLYIAYSPIETLPPDLSGLEALTDVELFYCPDMTEFPDGLATLPKLASLVFSSNLNVDSNELERALVLLNNSPTIAKTLQVLHVPNQPIVQVPDITNLTRLSLLNVQNCGIERFEKAFGKDHSFNQFLASYNELTFSGIPRDGEGYFIGIDDVESMDFSHNKIEILPDMFDAASVWSIGNINFSFNEIRDIENGGEGGTFKGVNATILLLGYNKLGRFPKEIFKADSQITYLQLPGNGIESIDENSFEGKYTHYMTTLDLSYNKLKKLPNTFNNAILPYMTGLDLSYNRFDAFPYSALNIANLTILICRHQRDAEGNRTLREWPAGVSQHKGLRALYLGSNDLRKISDSERISYLIYNLEISDNPNIVIDVSDVCQHIRAGVFNLIYDPTQDIRGCSALDLDR